MDVDTTDFEVAADILSIDPSESEISGYMETLATLVDILPEPPGPPRSPVPVEHVRPGDDNFGAFRFRFQATMNAVEESSLTVAVKDNIAVAGVPMTCGSPDFRYTPTNDSTVVRRLRSAGLEVVGTTNMDEFALSTTGETCAYSEITNPESPSTVPGGSSGGSGAAVAAGFVDAALGSDTGGSIRIPAAFCGVVGIKPTHRTVSRFGFADLSPTVDVVGPLADSVENASTVLQVISGADRLDQSMCQSNHLKALDYPPSTPLENVTVGVVEDAIARATSDVSESIKSVVEVLERSGIDVEYLSIDGFDTAVEILEGITGPELVTLFLGNGHVFGTGPSYDEGFRKAIEDYRHAGRYGDILREQLWINLALLVSNGGKSYVAAQNARCEFENRMADALSSVDALLTPTTPRTAPTVGDLTARDEYRELAAFTAPFNLTGGPAVSLPIQTNGGSTIGIQFGGSRLSEPLLLAIAARIEDQL